MDSTCPIKKFIIEYKIEQINENIIDFDYRSITDDSDYIFQSVEDEKIKKYSHIIQQLITINFEPINNYSILKKMLATIHFKNIFDKKVTILKQINNTHKLFDKEFNFAKYNYQNNKKNSSRENIIFQKLLHIYKTHPHLLVFFSEYILPIKFIKKLRADFFCLIVDKNNSIKKITLKKNSVKIIILSF